MHSLPSLSRIWRRIGSELAQEMDVIREFAARHLSVLRLVALRLRQPAQTAIAAGDHLQAGQRSTAPSPLFRTQVVDARRDQWLGEAQLVHPLPVRIVVGVCLALTIATLLFAIFGTYTRRVHAEGMLAPNVGLMTIASPTAGRVGSAGVHEGAKVEKGQLLYTIDVDAVSTNGPTQKRVIAQLQSQKTSVERQRTVRASVAKVEKTALDDQLANTIAQHQGTKSQLALQQKLTQSLKDRADQLQRASANGLARASDFQNQNYLYIQANSQLAQFLQTGLQLEGKIADLRAQIAEFDDKLARELAEMDRTAASLEQQMAESEAKHAIEIRAPEKGILTSIRVHAGQQVPAGGTLLTLLPSLGRLQANLFVDSSAIGFVEKDAPVMLRYAAFPFQRFGLYHGAVSEVTRAPVEAADMPETARLEGNRSKTDKVSDGLYRIIVRPDEDHVITYGEPRPLEAGMRVEADIALEKRPLYRWLIDPVYHLKRSADLVTGGAGR